MSLQIVLQLYSNLTVPTYDSLWGPQLWRGATCARVAPIVNQTDPQPSDEQPEDAQPAPEPLCPFVRKKRKCKKDKRDKRRARRQTRARPKPVIKRPTKRPRIRIQQPHSSQVGFKRGGSRRA